MCVLVFSVLLLVSVVVLVFVLCCIGEVSIRVGDDVRLCLCVWYCVRVFVCLFLSVLVC